MLDLSFEAIFCDKFWHHVVGLLNSKKMFPRFGCHNPRPAVDATFFEEIFRVLAGMFDLVEIGLGDRDGAVHGTKCHCVLSLCVFLLCSHLATS